MVGKQIHALSGVVVLLALLVSRAVKVQKEVEVVTHNYEIMFIVRPDVDEEKLKATREKIQATITGNGGEITDTKDMGKRRLAYEINKYREGVYTVYNFKATADVVNELDHVIRISDDIMRHIIVNMDEK